MLKGHLGIVVSVSCQQRQDVALQDIPFCQGAVEFPGLARLLFLARPWVDGERLRHQTACTSDSAKLSKCLDACTMSEAPARATAAS